MTKRTRVIALAIVCIAIIAGLSIGIVVFYSDQNGNKTQDHKVPELVSVDMQFKDNRTDPNAPFLQVTGRIHNEGNATANNCTLHMYAVQNGNTTAIDETVNLNSIEAGAYKTIDLTFNYTGEAIVAYNSPTLDWTN